MKTVVVIQARMGSTRFPGKVMAELAGKPMLRFMLERLRPLEDEGIYLVVATTTHAEDDVIDVLCHNEGVCCYRGSSEDVLSRFVEIAKDYDVIVRLTGDCPLVWAGAVRTALARHHKEGGNYTACLRVDGFEVQVYDRAALEALAGDYAREHLGPPSSGECHWVSPPKLSVDTPEDLERVREFVG